jgi:hypothetical protein
MASTPEKSVPGNDPNIKRVLVGYLPLSIVQERYYTGT